MHLGKHLVIVVVSVVVAVAFDSFVCFLRLLTDVSADGAEIPMRIS